MIQRTNILLIGGVLALALFGWAMAGPHEDGGAAYQRGDYAAAMRYRSPLAEQGDAKAEHGLGTLYFYGHGVPQDYTQAVAWFREAADRNIGGQDALGLMYRDGLGLPEKPLRPQEGRAASG